MANKQMEEEMRIMKQKMDSATSDMTRMTEDYIKLQSVLQQSDAVVDKFKRENEKLKMQVSANCHKF